MEHDDIKDGDDDDMFKSDQSQIHSPLVALMLTLRLVATTLGGLHSWFDLINANWTMDYRETIYIEVTKANWRRGSNDWETEAAGIQPSVVGKLELSDSLPAAKSQIEFVRYWHKIQTPGLLHMIIKTFLYSS